MEKLRVAQIGCGGRNGAHFQKLSAYDDVQIVGFCDIIRERAQARADAYGSGGVYTDYVTMLDETKPQVVFVAVPPHVHGEIEPALISRGIHFLIEKPMALDYSVAQKICRDAKAAGLITAVGFQDRYLSLTDIIRDYLKGRKVGLVTGAWIGGIPGVPWWRTFATSGGQIVEQNIHLFDELRWLFGEPASVYCASGKGIVDPEEYGVPGYDVDDYSSAVMKFDCGIVANLFTACYVREGSQTDSGLTIIGKDFTIRYHLRSSLEIHDITGTRTWVRDTHGWDYSRPWELVFTDVDGTVTRTPEDEQTFIQDRVFLDAVRSGCPCAIRSDYEDALKSLRLTLACNESAATGLPIKL